MYSNVIEKIKGINAINVTPFDSSLEIDWPALNDNINFLLNRGLEAIYPCGNTGEFYALTIDEAKEVTRVVTSLVAKRSLVIAGVGYDVKTACDLAQNAEACGADGLMVHQPIHPYLLADGLIQYYKQIAASTKLPIILYVRSEQISLEVLQETAKLPNVIGVKYAVNHLPSFTKAVQGVKEDLVWICGTAEMWAPYFFAAGAVGFTSGLVNVETIRPFKMLDALREGNYAEAMSIWEEVAPFEDLRAKYNTGNNVTVVKEAMFQLGLLPSKAVRPPISLLNENEVKQVTNLLKDWGLY
ncbi:dihydrodipicolinate synthase family protein [Paenibacillus radicis (ex Xue et al. 2023)]|uniref:Dihydrodipicolinate synthase family protein n=1 Tax=Paenibacillus radicis (ex Xue et al. 2023) TaxID=2972489 RepID=A0ABT1Y9S6_9BACL|nr:dihydrodipicolinate synthase family protein [Paenibacillus radicis (ex Xue et al. 2023)]MCR8629944.1 dihydrodipicolinate synthase family protein [Paenibacillus radicis (ex Xue et al. 2023)]